MVQIFQSMWELGIPCAFRLMTGAYCPGCGGTRATIHLLHGRVGLSIQYHPFVIYSLWLLLLCGLLLVLPRKGRIRSWILKKYPLFIYLGIAIVLINWGYKNYMLLIRGIDLLP